MFHETHCQNICRNSAGIIALLLVSVIWHFTTPSVVHADREGAPVLRQVAVPIELVDAVATRLNLHYHGEVGVTITADDRDGGAILVMAPPTVHARIATDAAALVERLAPAREASAKQTSMTVHLMHISWREAEDILRTIAGENAAVTTSRNGERASFEISLDDNSNPSRIEVDRRSNQIVVTTATQSVSTWQSVFSAIDTKSTRRDEQTYVYRLVHAEVAPVQRAIRLLRDLDRRNAPAARAMPINRPAAFGGKPKTQTASFRTVAFQQEGEPSEQDEPTPSADVAASDAEFESESGTIGDTDIQIVPDSGLIIIKGAKRDVERIKKVIAEIEAQAKITQPEVEVRPLLHADSNAVATLLQQLYEDVLSARQGDVSITALDAPNALLLIGRAEAIKAVLDLVEKVDQPIPETDRLRVYRLKHASAADAETTIREFFTNQPGEDEDNRPGLGNRVRISADFRTNSLIVAASPRDMIEVTRLVEQLDVLRTASSSMIRIFPLRNARAEDLAPVLQDAITAEPENTPDETTPKSSTLSIVALGSSGNAVLDSGVLTGAVITADANANAIVVRAPSEGMPLIAELIRQLDQTTGIDSLVKVFTVENGDAAQLTAALQDLFGDDAGTSGTSIGAGNQIGLPPLSAAESALVALRFSTDARTNSIIASGSAEDLEVVESILLRLDSTGFAERITEVIWLKNQVAANIAGAIQEYVQSRVQAQQFIPQLQQGLGPYDLPDRDLIVVAEPQTNSLLLSVSPRLYEEVRRLIDRLDRRPPMILIKTLIAEIALDDGFEIGGEFGLQDSVLFDRGVANPAGGPNPQSIPGFNFNNAGQPNVSSAGRNTLASSGVTAFGAGSSAISTLGQSGFVFSAASDSVSLFLRTLQIANRAQILSRPEIMTADNTPGFIQVGQTFPRPSNLQVTQIGQTLIGVEDTEIGIILVVTPRVGSDGLILMDIDAQRSSISPTDGQAIGTDANGAPIFVPAIDKTQAQATITAFDGQTVVFGGLITKSRSNFSRRVPYLADIPLLGTFFKFEGEEERRTELLIVMTPMLVTGHEDLEYVKQVESNRMSWCLADVVEAHGDVGLSGGYGLWGPAIGPTIYPDVHPTVDAFPAADMPKNSAIRTGLPTYTDTPMHAPTMASPNQEFPNSQVPNSLIPGVELAPGESILSYPGMIGSEAGQSLIGTPMSSSGNRETLPYGKLPETSQAPVWSPDALTAPRSSQPNEMLPPPTELPVPRSTLPNSVTASGASMSIPFTPTTMRTASSGAPSTTDAANPPTTPAATPKRWSRFNSKLGSFISPSK